MFNPFKKKETDVSERVKDRKRSKKTDDGKHKQEDTNP